MFFCERQYYNEWMVLFRTNNVLHMLCVLEQAKRSSVSHRVSSDESKTVGSFHLADVT